MKKKRKLFLPMANHSVSGYDHVRVDINNNKNLFLSLIIVYLHKEEKDLCSTLTIVSVPRFFPPGMGGGSPTRKKRGKLIATTFEQTTEASGRKEK